MAPNRYLAAIARTEGLPIILVFGLLLCLFMYTAPEVFLSHNIYTTFLSTLPPLVPRVPDLLHLKEQQYTRHGAVFAGRRKVSQETTFPCRPSRPADQAHAGPD